MTVDCTVRHHGGLMLAALSGGLTLSDVAAVQIHLLKCLAEQPRALLVDLSGMTVAQPVALAVFSSVVGQAARWPGTDILFCAAGQDTADLMSAASFRRLERFPSVDAACDHIERDGHRMPTVAEELLPVTGAARHGRDVATETCLRWELPELVAPASLVCSELISNVVDHAHTMMTLRLSLGSMFLFIAVRDGSPTEPVAMPSGPSRERGRGLQIVAATAHSWGCVPARGGKVVWASLLQGGPPERSGAG
ncbi:MAG TPA: ATP-binding protein [Actinoplanes sp.]|nr:ATP-binding protein [Actinoplanes sp.]